MIPFVLTILGGYLIGSSSESKMSDGGEVNDYARNYVVYYDSYKDKFGKGGKVKFKDKVKAIADSLEGTKVKPKYQKMYGKRYNREEAEQAGRAIAGKQLKSIKE